MKALHVLHHSLPTLADGYAIRSHSILRAQQAHGVDVVALTGMGEVDAPPATVDGIRYLRTPILKAPSSMLRPAWRYRALRKILDTVVERERPDVIHVHSPVYNGLAAVHAGARHRIPVVYEMRAVWEDAAVDSRKTTAKSAFYAAARALETHVLRKAGAVVTICNGLRNEVLSRGIDTAKLFVVPNAVQPDSFHVSARDPELAKELGIRDGVVFGFIGSLFKYEGVEDVLAAASTVIERHPNVQILIVGGGEREAQVRARMEEWPVKNQVIYRPRVPHSEVHRYYSLVDCFVYARLSVRLTELVSPLKPLEAMAMGRGVIASDIGGHRELIEHNVTGMLYPAGDKQALVDMMCEIASRPDIRARLADTGRRHVLEQKTWQIVVNNHLLAYKHVLSRADLNITPFTPPSTRNDTVRSCAASKSL